MATREIVRPHAGFAVSVPITWCEIAPGEESEQCRFSATDNRLTSLSIYYWPSVDRSEIAERVKMRLGTAGFVDLKEDVSQLASRPALQLSSERQMGSRVVRLQYDVLEVSGGAYAFYSRALSDDPSVDGARESFRLTGVDPTATVPPWVGHNLSRATPPTPNTSARRTEVVLIGPVGSGKTTIGKLVALKLRLPLVDMDAICGRYYAEVGRTLAEWNTRMESGRLEASRWLAPALAHATERLVSEYRGSPISLGAGHTHYEEPELFERVRYALEPFGSVVLLLPEADHARSIEILRKRSMRERGQDWIWDGHDFFARWVTDTCNWELADHVVYTEGRTPEQTCEEVLALAQS